MQFKKKIKTLTQTLCLKLVHLGEKNKNVSLIIVVFVCYSASTANMAKLEEMERLLREAQAEKRSLLEHKVTQGIFIWLILFIYLKMKYKNPCLILAVDQTFLPH